VTDTADTIAQPLLRLTDRAAAAALRAAGARWFLGLDPVTQNDELLARTLTAVGATVFGHGDAVVGYTLNPDHPGQAVVDTTGTDPAPLAACLDFLHEYLRCDTFVALVAVDRDPAALRGFAVVGRLRGHEYRGGTYHDVDVYFRAREGTCAR